MHVVLLILSLTYAVVAGFASYKIIRLGKDMKRQTDALRNGRGVCGHVIAGGLPKPASWLHCPKCGDRL